MNGNQLPESALVGSDSQVEWALRIRTQVNAEFDRVAASFQSVAARQNAAKRDETQAIIAILEDKRTEVMARHEAGYFIRSWQEISDQVRQLIFADARYKALKSKRAS